MLVQDYCKCDERKDIPITFLKKEIFNCLGECKGSQDEPRRFFY